MTIPLSLLLGPLAKASGLKAPSAVELWQNRQRGPVGSPAYYAQQNLDRPEDKQIDIGNTNTPWGIQNSDPEYWQMPYRDATQRHPQDWARPVSGHTVTNPLTGEVAGVPKSIQPQEPSAFAKLIGAPGVPSSSGFDSRGDSSAYAGQGSRGLAKFAGAKNPGQATRTFGSRNNETGQLSSSWYTPGEGVSSTNLVAKENISKPERDSGSEGKGGK